MVIDTNRTITAPNPEFNPKKFTTYKIPSSKVLGMVNSDKKVFSGIANFITFAIAFIENKIKRIIDANLAYFLRLGNLLLIPLPRTVPCKIPIPKTIVYEIKKFSSARLRISKNDFNKRRFPN